MAQQLTRNADASSNGNVGCGCAEIPECPPGCPPCEDPCGVACTDVSAQSSDRALLSLLSVPGSTGFVLAGSGAPGDSSVVISPGGGTGVPVSASASRGDGTQVLSPFGSAVGSAVGTSLGGFGAGVILSPRTTLTPPGAAGSTPPEAGARPDSDGWIGGRGLAPMMQIPGATLGGFATTLLKHTPPQVTAVRLDETKEEKRVREAAQAARAASAGRSLDFESFGAAPVPSGAVNLRGQLGSGSLHSLRDPGGAKSFSAAAEQSARIAESGVTKSKWEQAQESAGIATSGEDPSKLGLATASGLAGLKPSVKDAWKSATPQMLAGFQGSTTGAPPALANVPGAGSGAGPGGSSDRGSGSAASEARRIRAVDDDGQEFETTPGAGSAAGTSPSRQRGPQAIGRRPTAADASERSGSTYSESAFVPRESGAPESAQAGAGESGSAAARSETASLPGGVASSRDSGSSENEQSLAVSRSGAEETPDGTSSAQARGGRDSRASGRSAMKSTTHGSAMTRTGLPRESSPLPVASDASAEWVGAPSESSAARSPAAADADDGPHAASPAGAAITQATRPAAAYPNDSSDNSIGNRSVGGMRSDARTLDAESRASARAARPRLTPRGPDRLSVVPDSSALPAAGAAPGSGATPLVAPLDSALPIRDMRRAARTLGALGAPRGAGRPDTIVADTQVQPPLLVDPRTSALIGRPASRRSWSAPLSNDFARSLRTSDTIGPQPLPGSGVATPDALAGRGVVSAPDAWSFTGAGGSGVEASDAERPAPGGAPGVPPDAPADARTPPRPMDMPSEPWRGSQRTTAFGRSLEGMLQGVERRNADGTFHSRTLRASFGLWFASHGARGPDFSDPAERKAFLTEENSAALRELRSQFRAATDGMSRSEFDRAARDFKRALAAVLYRDMLNAWKQGGRKPPKPRRRDAERIAEWALHEVMQRSDENPPPPPPGGPELGAPGGGAADGGGGSGNGADFCPCPCKSPFEHLGSNSDSLDDDVVEPGEEPGGGGGGGGGDIYTWIRDRYPPMQPQPPGSEVIQPPGSFRQPGDWFTVRDREHSPADVVIGPGGGLTYYSDGPASAPAAAAPPPVAADANDGPSKEEGEAYQTFVDAQLLLLIAQIEQRRGRKLTRAELRRMRRSGSPTMRLIEARWALALARTKTERQLGSGDATHGEIQALALQLAELELHLSMNWFMALREFDAHSRQDAAAIVQLAQAVDDLAIELHPPGTGGHREISATLFVARSAVGRSVEGRDRDTLDFEEPGAPTDDEIVAAAEATRDARPGFLSRAGSAIGSSVMHYLENTSRAEFLADVGIAIAATVLGFGAAKYAAQGAVALAVNVFNAGKTAAATVGVLTGATVGGGVSGAAFAAGDQFRSWMGKGERSKFDWKAIAAGAALGAVTGLALGGIGTFVGAAARAIGSSFAANFPAATALLQTTLASAQRATQAAAAFVAEGARATAGAVASVGRSFARSGSAIANRFRDYASGKAATARVVAQRLRELVGLHVRVHGGENVASTAPGLRERVGKAFGLYPNAANPARQKVLIERFMREWGVDLKTAEELAKPYPTRNMGEHFFPRRLGDALDVPEELVESRFNVLRPGGISKGEMFELHFKVDAEFEGVAFGPRRSLRWSGQHLGLERYRGIEKLWYGSPAEFKLVAIPGGALAIGAGIADYQRAQRVREVRTVTPDQSAGTGR